MPRRMQHPENTPGRIMFHELNSHDLNAAREFYSQLFGWKFKEREPGYFYMHAGDTMVGGLFKLPVPEVPAHWIPYISVSTVEDALERAAAVGCKTLVPTMAVPNGRFAVLQDPQGAAFYAWQGRGGEREVGPRGPGNFSWDQLNTPDVAGSAGVYAKLFDWNTIEGPAGSKLFTKRDRPLAAVMQGPPGMRAHWLSFVHVENLQAARQRARDAGGKVMVEEIPVPGQGAFSVITDREGAVIAAFAE